MTSFKYFICIVTIACLTALISSGCEIQRYTTKFEVTPVMEDSTTDPQRLTKELDEELRMEDEKRRKVLLDKAKAEGEKENTSTKEKTEEVK